MTTEDKAQTPQEPSETPKPPQEAPKVEAQASEAPAKDPKVVTIPTRAMAQIKQAEREKGKKLAIQELNARAKALGFNTWEALEAAAIQKPSTAPKSPPAGLPEEAKETPQATQGQQPPKQVQPAQKASQKPSNGRDLQRELARAAEEKRRLNQQRAAEEKRRRALEQQLDATQAENALRLAAVKAGVTDPDYALHLLRNKLQNKSAEELESFDEDEFFSKNLRETHPYLYGVETRPASTSQSAAPPTPSKATQAPNGSGPIDARKLSREEFDQRLKQLNLTPPIIGMIS